MADTISLKATLALQIREILDAATVPTATSESQRTLTHNAYNLDASLNGSSTPPIDTVIPQTYTIAGGGTTRDLTSITKSVNRTADLTGKKLVAYLFAAPATNVGNVTIAKGATNGYAFNGNHSLEVKPGETKCAVIDGLASGMPAVASGAKNIDISGTNGDVLRMVLVFGTP